MELRDIVKKTDINWIREIAEKNSDAFEYRINDNLPGKAQFHYDRGTMYIAYNVKNEGIPDMVEIYEMVSNSVGVPVQQVERAYPFTEFLEDFYHILHDIYFSEWSVKYGISVYQVGRSAGYIAIHTDDVQWQADNEVIDSYIEEFIQWLEEDGVTVDEFLTDDGDIIEDEIVCKFDTFVSYKDSDEYMKLSYESKAMLESLENDIYITAEIMEKPEQWVNTIIENEWYK